MNYFVTAIGTDSGKTLASAILCEALGADYWKPVQAGFPRDAETIAQLVSNTATIIHPEAYLLTTAASPHAAARIDGVRIDLAKITLPQTRNTLIIEGAGGILVPLNDENFVVDLILKFKAEAILVSDLYLGSINHTLMTLEGLQRRNIPLQGIIFNRTPSPESERIILHHSKSRKLLHIQEETGISSDIVKKYARQLLEKINERPVSI
jgi:dethiobiotin synthetase